MNSAPPIAGEITGNVDSTTVVADPAGSTLLVTVQGWLLHTAEEIVDLYFEAPNAHRSRTSRTLRPDIENNFPDVPYARESGYSVSFEFQGKELRTPLSINFFATLKSGQRISTRIEIPIQLPPSAPTSASFPDTPDTRLRHVALRNFLVSGKPLVFPPGSTPRLSVVIVTFNRAPDTFACLEALQKEVFPGVELIIIDNNSTDQTKNLLQAVSGARIVYNKDNLHFLRAAQQGAALASGEILLFLNSDANVLPGALRAVIDSFANHPKLGALGARLIHLDGTLQEVGGSLMPDGSNIGNGVGEHPLAVPFLLQRSVDYCSGAFLATPRKLWEHIGGFDLRYSPAYYEDVDYCVSIQQLGFEVLVEPRITVIHAEGAISHNSDEARALMLSNRAKFVEKNSGFLQGIPAQLPQDRPLRPPQTADLKHVLMIDDFFPRSSNGQGAPRAERIVNFLLSRQCRITYLALNELASEAAPLFSPEALIECRAIRRGSNLLEFLSLNGASYGTIIISRPHNMEDFQAIRSEYPICAANVRVVYDAEAIFALREIRKQQFVQDLSFSKEQLERIVSQEILRVKHADQFWAVSVAEAEEFTRRGLERVQVVAYGAEGTEKDPQLNQRKDILFVGPIVTSDSPNGEGFSWYQREVLPLLKSGVETAHVKTFHAGVENAASEVRDPLIIPCGQVADLASLYSTARVFIAPIRFGSGIPIKVIEAAAQGLPIVTTSYIAKQLRWENETELLVADNPALFAEQIRRLLTDDQLWYRLRQSLLNRIRDEFSLKRFDQALEESLSFPAA